MPEQPINFEEQNKLGQDTLSRLSRLTGLMRNNAHVNIGDRSYVISFVPETHNRINEGSWFKVEEGVPGSKGPSVYEFSWQHDGVLTNGNIDANLDALLDEFIATLEARKTAKGE